ncbi:2-aminoethylphosphonate--pyruvate transaminase [Vibrio ostreicida]|uniref:2-aminoethylphosphonate--pyruvate transaminase n=1 Tax=Vibrio ostreicida TaxID=526588 RepID=A0ABT8BWU7_9VIBR|nr:2-aminoethylphosphonate--pyruvate transaminase [Vibrio ostreicida]MDN3611463.1 2-aminoethylphosphonate--pyruvate transaminase [Vibrio ostreicida]NPD08964.1 2-aminoethylphosphonate--pyruvate transaminase [Vibrio ostreicida]
MNNDYLLLTPGPLSTTQSVRNAMLKDWCTWDDDYNIDIVEVIRHKLVSLATDANGYSCVLMQGSGTASVEATIGSAISAQGKLLVINNGAYGTRIQQIAQALSIPCHVVSCGETSPPDLNAINTALASDPAITHVALVHCETTTGMLNPIDAIIHIAKRHKKTVILDAMSSFGGIGFDLAEMGVDFMISSANKCIQGVPGFGFVIAKTSQLEQCRGQARSLTLDLYDQWQCMQTHHGKWRFTSPTHAVHAFYQALQELEQEGGIEARYQRYHTNQTKLVSGLRALGFRPLLSQDLHSPIITSFHSPDSADYRFKDFYQRLKAQGFVIYPGKVSEADCFRIGNIGDVHPDDIERLIEAVKQAMYWHSPQVSV